MTLLVKWNESGFRPPLCTYRLNWARRTSWGWWDDWDDTVLQTQDSKFEPWRSEVEHATSRSRRLPTILTFTRGWGRNIFVSFKPPRPGSEPRTLAWKAAVLTTTLGPPPNTIGSWDHLVHSGSFRKIYFRPFNTNSKRFFYVYASFPETLSAGIVYYVIKLEKTYQTVCSTAGLSTISSSLSYLWTTWHILK